MNNKKQTIIVTFAITLLMIALVGATYAYFIAQAGGTTSKNINVTSNTTDNLAFQISNDISFTVTQADFYENAGNKDGYATASAILTPNNYTGAATMNYYLYLLLDSNPTVYSEENTNDDAELLLQLFDSNNQLVTLTGLGSQVTVEDGLGNNITGYDITGVEGTKTLLSNQSISASNNTATTQTWRVVITLINYDFNQNDNTGKTITGRLVIRKDSMFYYAYWNNNFAGDTGANLFDSSHMPVTTYPTISALETEYGSSNFAINPVYIMSTVVDGTPTGHKTCLLYDDVEFCLEPNYWIGDSADETDGSSTKDKLKDDMEIILGVQLYDSILEAEQAGHDWYFCESNSLSVYCYVGDYYCGSNSLGNVVCASGSTGKHCMANSDNSAYCGTWD